MVWTPGTTAEYVERWQVRPDGPAWRTPSSELLAGTRHGTPVVLKVARVEEESRGARLLAAWQGRGAVPVLERDERAVLMRRATGPGDLAGLAASGRDEEATRILLTALDALHAVPSPTDLPGLMPLAAWFRALTASGGGHGDPFLDRAASIARELLESTPAEDVRALHGDLHHGNVLDLDGSGSRWVVIDPKGLVGHRLFDVANLLCNPDLDTALTNLDRRLEAITGALRADRRAVARWTVAWCGLSAVWSAEDDAESEHAATVRAVGRRLLDGLGH